MLNEYFTKFKVVRKLFKTPQKKKQKTRVIFGGL